MKKLPNFIDNNQHLLVYLLFGGLTTLVNFLVYFPLYNWLYWSGTLSNLLAWVAAVIFAFLTNKPFVFKSHDWSPRIVLSEVFKFVSCRITSGLLETVTIWLFVDQMNWNGNWIKILVSVFVVILNYIFSKWIVFSGKDKP